jgi:hypothetical protein
MDTKDLKGPWAFVQFGAEAKEELLFKSHYCPVELAADLVTDLESRGGRVSALSDVSEGSIDLPGMITADRPWEDLTVGGLKLGIPSQDFGYFAAKLKCSPARRFASGKEYHKIHGWLVCVVVTPEQRSGMLADMEAMMPDADRRQGEADARLEKGLERMRQAGYAVPVLSPGPESPKGRN